MIRSIGVFPSVMSTHRCNRPVTMIDVGLAELLASQPSIMQPQLQQPNNSSRSPRSSPNAQISHPLLVPAETNTVGQGEQQRRALQLVIAVLNRSFRIRHVPRGRTAAAAAV
mmetsp:Transcript_18803/g.35488  ORF Transcript_18803/g.35488 Transcript_18803/m.35488 type:complete len:112 (-) Transcript_18803:80-415(-)